MEQVQQKQRTVLVEDIMIANQRIKDVVLHTPLQYNPLLSAQYDCKLYLKREDLQVVRSFKIRGAYNRIKSSVRRSSPTASLVPVPATMRRV